MSIDMSSHEKHVAHQGVPFIPFVISGGWTAISALSTAYSVLGQASNIGTQIQGVLAPPQEEKTSFFKDSAAWSLSSYIMYYTGKYAFNHFIETHGPLASDKLTSVVSNGWKRATSLVEQKKTDKDFQSKMQVSADSMMKLGSSDAVSQIIAKFPEKNKTLLLLAVGIAAIFTHSLGAAEMQKQIQQTANREKHKELEDDEAYWGNIDLTAKKDPKQKKTIYLDKTIRNLYMDSEFYTSGKGIVDSLRIPRLQDISVVRAIFNIFVGATVQANAFFLGSFSNDDAILHFSQWANMAMYWEILAHLLRLHGWAPVYTALKMVAHLLAQPAAEVHIKVKGKSKIRK